MRNVVNNILKSRTTRIKKLFQLMDSDEDGYLDYNETKAALKALGLAVKKSFVVSIMRIYTKNNDKIGFEDFNYVVLDKLNKQSLSDQAKFAFKLLTEGSKNDKIMLKDLLRMNEKLDCDLTIEEMEYMIQEFDLNQDGSLDETEFIEMMREPGI